MHEKKRGRQKTKTNSLEVGDQVQYTIDTKAGPIQRIGKIFFIDEPWYVVQHNGEHWVWVSLRCA